MKQSVEAPPATASPRQGWYVVAICMVAYVFSFIDRQILSLLIGPIQADLKLSDTEFGLLSGLAFALFYAALGLPIATLADRKSRPLIIALGVAFWSLATAACGLVQTFWQLFAARVCVGAGEAALTPATYSLLSDLFPKDRLGRAAAVLFAGLLHRRGRRLPGGRRGDRPRRDPRRLRPGRMAAAPMAAGVRDGRPARPADRRPDRPDRAGALCGRAPPSRRHSAFPRR